MHVQNLLQKIALKLSLRMLNLIKFIKIKQAKYLIGIYLENKIA